MPKRKREEESVSAVFFKYRTDLFHALKNAKGFERQRQSKRLRDARSTPDKKARIEKEIVVLKSLDLHQTAHAHLCSSLLRIKSIAEAPKLPNEIKEGIPKPELTEDEKAALHNVTSGLYNQEKVRAVIDQAIAGISNSLGIPVPEKGKKAKKDKKEEAPQPPPPAKDKKEKAKEPAPEKKKKPAKPEDEEDESADIAIDEEEAEKVIAKLSQRVAFSDDDDDDEENHGDSEDNSDSEFEEDEPIDIGNIDEEEVEKAISKLSDMLGSDSDDEAGQPSHKPELDPMEITDDESTAPPPTTKSKQPLPKHLDPMEITTDEEAGEDDDLPSDLDPMEVSSDEEENSSEEFNGFSDSHSHPSSDQEEASQSESDTPPPAKKSKSSSTAPIKPVSGSTFLPSLMGGYISGSESASDVDVAPPRKNRRGQRARQAIWEKRYKEQAKHLKEGKKARDQGWDLKRGAVGPDDNKPWKKGIKNPLLGTGANQMALPKEEAVQKKRVRDDTGPLHPSWEAKRLAKEKERLTAPFEGKKITFD
ncbi:Bud-site selection protein [Podospora australis]|uniref:Bud-site selection protein n=1 Tax=Podospora australis TaxID=1536484 RepID=A0AAN6WXY7_9PEZI|nr:Bud-site selection protein [Podospora australis]